MIVAVSVAAVLAALLHGYIWFLELFDWTGRARSVFQAIRTDVPDREMDAGDRQYYSGWKCAAGVGGGVITGATTGGLGGAAVGTVTLPVVGTVGAGTVGAQSGARWAVASRAPRRRASERRVEGGNPMKNTTSPGFKSFASPQLAAVMWAFTALATILFVTLGWPFLSMAILLVPLTGVTIVITVAAMGREPEERVNPGR